MDFTDRDSRDLLRLMAQYFVAYGTSGDENMTCEQLASDLAQSLDVTDDQADEDYRTIARGN